MQTRFTPPPRFFWLLHFLNFEKEINKGSGDIQDCYENTMLTKCRQIYACMLLGERKLHLHSAHVVHISINTHGEDQWKHPLGAQGSCGHPNHWKHFSLREFGIAETHTKCSSTHANKLTVTVKNVLKIILDKMWGTYLECSLRDGYTIILYFSMRK